MAPPLNPVNCCRPCLRRLCTPSSTSRSFSTTRFRRKHGALPTFTPTSSPELDTLLSTFRTNVFLPSHLITAQRSLLYRPKNHGLLTNPDEPATVKVGGEVLQLHPLNHLRDEPPTNQSIAKVLELMKEGKDWANLPGFLEGLRTAKRKMKAAQLEKLVRRANGCGRQGVVLVCLQRVERTGLGLWDGPVARECMLGAVMRGMEGAWETEAVEDAARLARAYWELMWDDRHSKARGANVKLMPEVVGIMVLLSAARLLKGGETKEELEKFGQRLLGLGGKMDFTVDEQDWVQANHKLVAWAPVSQGMQLARKALGEESQLGRELGVMAQKDLEPMLRKALAAVYEHTPEDGSRRGAKLYGDLAQANL